VLLEVADHGEAARRRDGVRGERVTRLVLDGRRRRSPEGIGPPSRSGARRRAARSRSSAPCRRRGCRARRPPSSARTRSRARPKPVTISSKIRTARPSRRRAPSPRR
jgi:hypothetical protein